MPTRDAPGPGLLDALSLLVEVADELGVRTARDTHLAWLDRVHGVLDRSLGPTSASAGRAHRMIATGVYGGLGAGLQVVTRGLDAAVAAGLDDHTGPRLDDRPRGQLVRAAVNGLIGDRLEQERPRLAITMAPRVGGRDVPLTAEGLAAAYPTATGRVVVLLHGLFENDACWQRARVRRGTTYAEELAELGWTPVLLRANSGLPVRTNGAALASVLETLVAHWPTEVTQVALIGHSMGGLVIRAATAVQGEWTWRERVSDVVTLGTPHLGAPLARGVRQGSGLLGRLPEVAGFGRILDQRSAGVDDLIEGLDEDFAPLPHARYRLVSATLAASPRHPTSAFFGDLLVRQDSAYGRDRRGRNLFPDGEVLHLRGHHFDLLNDDRVAAALTRWLA